MLHHPLKNDLLPILSPHGMGNKKGIHCPTGTRTSRISVRTGRVATRPRMAHAADFPIGLYFVPVVCIPCGLSIGMTIRDLSRRAMGGMTEIGSISPA